MKPRALDLCGGQGGAAEGYARAGFEVIGLDRARRYKLDGTWMTDRAILQRYPFQMIQADALEFLASVRSLKPFALVHGSPPCQFASRGSLIRGTAGNHEDLLTPMRELLIGHGVPWVIENVPGAPMRADYKLCGCMFGLRAGDRPLIRERWFETSWHGFDLRPPCQHKGNPITVATHGGPNGNRGTMAEREAAMGIDWMTTHGLGEAVPPAYTEYIGRAFLGRMEAAA